MQASEIAHKKVSEHLKNVRFIGRIGGCYQLHDRTSKNGVKVFACSTQSVSPFQVVINAPVAGANLARVSINLDHLGVVTGKVTRRFTGGMTVNLLPERTDFELLASRITWVSKRALNIAEDHRSSKRIMPRNPRSRLIFGDATIMECFVIDMSETGVAVSADICPEVGTPLAVGSVVGVVVRHLKNGFAVNFVETLEREFIEPRLCNADGLIG